MFDKITVHKPNEKGRTKHSYIQEFKAPTDDAIRLLGEMEEKTRERIVRAIEVDNNTISGMMYVLAPDYLGQRYQFMAKVVINGKELLIKEEISFFDITKSYDGLVDMLKILYKNVAEKIATDLMDSVVHTESFKQMVRSVEIGNNKNL